MKIEDNYPLAEVHTFGAKVYARQFCVLRSLEDVAHLRKNYGLLTQKTLLLGGGSNLLFKNDFEGMVVKNEIMGLAVENESVQELVIGVGGGENWHKLVLFAVKNGWQGIENLALIPGTVGAAPIQNIGAYGVELKDVFAYLEAIDLQTGALKRFSKEDCQFGYRDSYFKRGGKGRFLIVKVALKLRKVPEYHVKYAALADALAAKGNPPLSPELICQVVTEVRQSKLPDPAILGNCGSFFKNPEISAARFEGLRRQWPMVVGYPTSPGKVKVPAGWLIENAGWKGKKLGNVGTYARQALVIVNHGGATGEEAWTFAQKVQEAVMEKYAILLEPEVNII